MAVDLGVWISRLILSAVFALSAFGKLADRPGTRKAVAEFGIPAGWAGAAAWVLPLVEACLAGALLPAATAPWAGLASLLLLCVFMAAPATAVTGP